MDMKKNKGFTLVEIIVVLAVSTIILGMVATLSVLTTKIVQNQKHSTACISEFSSAKNEVETFISNYSTDSYTIYLQQNTDDDNNVYYGSLIIKNASTLEEVAWIEFENNTLSLFALNEETSQKTLSNSVSLSKVTKIEFDTDNSLNLLKSKFLFLDFQDQTFLTNIGGMEIGY